MKGDGRKGNKFPFDIVAMVLRFVVGFVHGFL